MVKLSKLYTKTGDDGTTGLIGGKRIRKDTLRVAAYGDIDELNTLIGLARTESEKKQIVKITEKLTSLQNTLFNLGSELATDPDTSWEGMITVEESDTAKLEKEIDEMVALVPELKSFVLPGGTELNARLHQSRAVCRRAERTILTLANSETVRSELITYINRLSDYLFALSRYATLLEGGREYLWAPGKDKPQE